MYFKEDPRIPVVFLWIAGSNDCSRRSDARKYFHLAIIRELHSRRVKLRNEITA